MNAQAFWTEMDARIAEYDLLCHPFYQAWSAGKLTREDMREYAADYYHHVAAFPTYLSALHARLEDGELRRALIRNCAEEEGVDGPGGRAHSELWLDFAEGMGADRGAVKTRVPPPEIREMIARFRSVAEKGSLVEALASFYAYESQVPGVAEEKAKGLKNERYGASARTRAYFTVHAYVDIHHAEVWRTLLQQEIEKNPAKADVALKAAETTARMIYEALDGVERLRKVRAAA